MFLAVVYPADDWYHRVHKRLVVHAVLAMEMDSLRIGTMKQVIGVYCRVLVAKESEDALALLVSNTTEALFRLVLILLDQRLVNIEFLNAVLSGILELLGTRHAMCLHRFAHLQGCVDADAVETIELLSIHATHRRADNQAGLLLLTDIAQQGDGLCRMNGQVGSDDLSLWHHLTESCHCTRLSATGKTMTIEDCLASHQFGELLDVWILCNHVCKDNIFFYILVTLIKKMLSIGMKVGLFDKKLASFRYFC